MFKVNNRNTRTRCEICSKLTINIPERHHRLYHKVFQMFAICVFPEFPQNFFYTKLRNSSWLSVGKVTLNSSAEASFSSLMYVVCICKFGWIIVDVNSVWQGWQFVKSFFPWLSLQSVCLFHLKQIAHLPVLLSLCKILNSSGS